MASGESAGAGVRDPDLARREESMGQLFKDLSDDLSTLMRQELALAQAEMTQKGKKAGLGIGLLGVGGLLGVVGLLALTATIIALLATTMQVWVAALIVTAVYFILAGALALVGKNRVAEAVPPLPEQTTATLKEDAQWAKTQLPSGKK
jgi:uncharacterized membrane protein YqjE